jgi:hypothetical protein
MTNSKLFSIDTITASVKDFLSSFEQADLIDDDNLITWSLWVINRLGIGVKVEKQLVAKVENYKVQVPPYFDILWSIHNCNKCTPDKEENIKLEHSITYIKEDFYKDGSCTIKVDTDPTIITEKWVLENKKVQETQYCDRQLLSLGQGIDKQRLHGECVNYYNSCKNEFSLDSNYFYFNFTDNYVHMQYYANPFDDEGYPLILDDEYVIKAVEDYLIFKSLQKIYINGKVDVQTRMQYYQSEHRTSLGEALFNVKLDTFNTLIKSAKERPKYLEIYNLSSTSDGWKK